MPGFFASRLALMITAIALLFWGTLPFLGTLPLAEGFAQAAVWQRDGEQSSWEPAKKVRRWMSKSGSFSVMATFVSQTDSEVTLKTTPGKTITVKKTKLGVQEREFLKEIAAAAAEENPFIAVNEPTNDSLDEESMDVDDSDWFEKAVQRFSRSSAVAPADNAGLINPNQSKKSGSKIEIGPIPKIEFSRNSIGPKMPVFAEHSVHTRYSKPVISLNRQYAAFACRNSFEEGHFLAINDLQTGAHQLVQLPVDYDSREELIVVAVSDDGKKVVTGTVEYSVAGSLDFWHIHRGHSVLIKRWNSKKFDDFGIERGYLTSASRLLTFGKTIRMWDLDKQKSIYGFDVSNDRYINRDANPIVMSPDGRMFTLPDAANLFFVDVATGEIAGKIELPAETTSGLSVSFSPDGSQIAVLLGDYLYRWQVSDGKALRKIATFSKGALRWVQENYILAGENLIDLRLGAVVWQYAIGTQESEVLWFGQPGVELFEDGNMAFRAVPHIDLHQRLKGYSPEDLAIVQLGDTFQVEIKGLKFSAKVNKEIRANAERELQDAGAQPATENPALTLQISLQVGKRTTAKVRDFHDYSADQRSDLPSITYTPKRGKIKLLRGKDVVWRQSHLFTVGHVLTPHEDESSQQYADRMAKVTPKFFQSFRVLEELRTLPESKVGKTTLTLKSSN